MGTNNPHRGAWSRGTMPFNGARQAKILTTRSHKIADEVLFFLESNDLLPGQRSFRLKESGPIGEETYTVVVCWKSLPPTKETFYQWCDFAYGYRKAASLRDRKEVTS